VRDTLEAILEETEDEEEGTQATNEKYKVLWKL